MWDRKSTKYRQGLDPSPDQGMAMGVGMGARSNRKLLRSLAESRVSGSSDLEMQGLKSVLSYLWVEKEEGKRRRNCLHLAHTSFPPLLVHISLHS